MAIATAERGQAEMKLTFLGATGTVTGSKYFLDTGSRTVPVDCGLYQGLRQLRLRIEEKFAW